MSRLVTIALVAGIAVAGCGNKSKKKAVPAEVDVEWPDAATFPSDDSTQPDPPEEPGADAGAPSDPSMSTGSDG